MALQWHRGALPPTTEQVCDVMAKAMLLRSGGIVAIDPDELTKAADTQCEIAIAEDGVFHFRVEMN